MFARSSWCFAVAHCYGHDPSGSMYICNFAEIARTNNLMSAVISDPTRHHEELELLRQEVEDLTSTSSYD